MYVHHIYIHTCYMYNVCYKSYIDVIKITPYNHKLKTNTASQYICCTNGLMQINNNIFFRKLKTFVHINVELSGAFSKMYKPKI